MVIMIVALMVFYGLYLGCKHGGLWWPQDSGAKIDVPLVKSPTHDIWLKIELKKKFPKNNKNFYLQIINSNPFFLFNFHIEVFIKIKQVQVYH